jgi:hypothetical protein
MTLFACQDEFEQQCSAVCPDEPTSCEGRGEIDCTQSCADQARSANQHGCRDQSVDHWQCLAQTDLCSEEVPEECRDEFDALYACLEGATGEGGSSGDGGQGGGA